MADPTAPNYAWRPTGSQQQPPTMFGALNNPYFGSNLSSAVQNAGGYQSPIAPASAPPQQQSGGFNVPGGNSAGFNSPAFQAASPNDGAKAQPAQAPAATSFGDALRTNPFAQPLINQASQNIMQGLNPQGPSMSSMFALNEENKGEAEALRKTQEASALGGRAMTGQLPGDTANYLAKTLIPQRQNFLGQLQGNEDQLQQQRQQNAFGNLATLAGMGQQGEQFNASLAQTGDIANKQIAASTAASQLSSETQKYVSDNQIGMDSKQLNAQIAQFSSNLDFQKWATQAGIDNQSAQRMWQANQNDVQRKFDQGQQLSAQENNVLLETMKQAHDTDMTNLNHTLNLDTLDKQQAHDLVLKNMDQSFASLMTDKGYSHEEAMAATQQDYAKELAKMGYDQQTALQASQQWATAQEHDKDLSQAKMLSEAQMAQSADFFNQDLQQKYNFKQQDVDLAKQQLAQNASQWAASFGLDSQKFALVKDTQEFQNLTDVTSTLTAMAGDDPDAQRFAALNFYKGLGNLKGPDGTPLMDSNQIAQGELGITASSFQDANSFKNWALTQTNSDGTPKYTADQVTAASQKVGSAVAAGDKLTNETFSSVVDKSGAFAGPDDAEKFKSSMLHYSQIGKQMSPDKIGGVPDDPDLNHMIDAANQKLQSAGVDISKLYTSNKVGNYSSHTVFNASQNGLDYAIYNNMTTYMSDADAKKAFTSLVGDARAKAAFAVDPSLSGSTASK